MKYIFIDSNQYRHLFSKNEGFSDSTKKVLNELIENQKIKLLIPQQVVDEVERNRLEDWCVQEINNCKSRIESKTKLIESKRKDLQSFPEERDAIIKRITKEILNEEKELKRVKTRFRSGKSKANKKLQSILKMGEIIPETDEIVNLARLRLEKGNPPKDNKLGDALVWESPLFYFENNSAKGSTLIFVARDGNAWGSDGFNPWLIAELKRRAKVNIVLAKGLSDIEELTKEEQDEIKKLEEQESKNNAISNFVSSTSWVNAGQNATELRQYKDFLMKSDYEQIIDASISNFQIYQSFFTSSDLNYLCRGEDGYVVDVLETIDSDKWKKFAMLNQIASRRRVDEKVNDVDF